MKVRQLGRRPTSILLILLLSSSLLAQGTADPVVRVGNQPDPAGAPAPPPAPSPPQTPGSSGSRVITLTDAVNLFLQQNLQLVAARYDIDMADAEKLKERIRPDPTVSFESADLPLKFTGPLVKEQTYSYGVEQTFELGGKRAKRIDAANASSELARAQFETVLWQLTNDLKRRFYTVLLNASLFKLAQENQATFADTLQRSEELYKLGEISGLDQQRLEVEKFKFDTDVANTERDYEVALRDLRIALGGDYRTMDFEVAGSIEYYQPYDFSFDDLRTKALAARPDLKAAQVSEQAANSNIRLQDSGRIPDVTLSGGVDQAPLGGSSYTFGVGVTLPLSNRNQGERAKALIQKQQALNQQQLLTNQIQNDVDKALVAFQLQKRRVELYRSGILAKVNNIQTQTEFSMKVGESSLLELLDAIRTRRDTMASFYQTLFDYESALLDLELATATPLQK